VNRNLEDLATEFASRKDGTLVEYSEAGNAWLPYPFIGVTRPNGARFALYFRDDELFYVPADSGTVRPAIAITKWRQDWDLETALDQIENLERQFDNPQPVPQPSFTASNPIARKTSEAVHNFRFNWLLPVSSGGFLLLLLFIVIATATPPSGGAGLDRISNSPPPVSTTQQPNPSPSFPSPLTPSSPPATGSFDRSPGYMVICNDGTVSYSGGKRGACSWHGGVR